MAWPNKRVDEFSQTFGIISHDPWMITSDFHWQTRQPIAVATWILQRLGCERRAMSSEQTMTLPYLVFSGLIITSRRLVQEILYSRPSILNFLNHIPLQLPSILTLTSPRGHVQSRRCQGLDHKPPLSPILTSDDVTIRLVPLFIDTRSFIPTETDEMRSKKSGSTIRTGLSGLTPSRPSTSRRRGENEEM
ncbi:hypothetical protein N658DRAFT_286687 [Parathielavia hyrcaniae]|uniref:Uncharacterized protein n=1 Tax=Parathielavia hyrcaniae TaxID=113614 RepID=A0AAN6T3I3_9PEZI|nr:hypothetical protein N658DRAFT_286687 [Parathielavia hyrcaniae]